MQKTCKHIPTHSWHRVERLTPGWREVTWRKIFIANRKLSLKVCIGVEYSLAVKLFLSDVHDWLSCLTRSSLPFLLYPFHIVISKSFGARKPTNFAYCEKKLIHNASNNLRKTFVFVKASEWALNQENKYKYNYKYLKLIPSW